MTKFIVIYVTSVNMEEAQSIAAACVNAQLVACANIFPEIQSLYKWQGKLIKDTEVGIFLKTTENKVTDVINVVKKTHSAKCPCIIALPVVGGNKSFLEWIQGSVT